MATITAKATSGSIYNVLDPNTWIGGVVPGPDDIAVFPSQLIRAYPAPTVATNYATYTPWTGYRTLTVNATTGFPASGSFYCFPELMQDVMLPVKIDYQSTSSITFISCSIDHSYREWRYQNSHSYTEKFPGDNPVAIGDLRSSNAYFYRGYGNATASINPSNWQNCYQLTGSSTWSVARIDINIACDFTVKDTARLNMFATSSASGYINILGGFSGVKLLDRMTFNATGSWNTATSSFNGILSNSAAATYVIMSGSSNYSSSLLASSSVAGTSTLTLQSPDSFGVGDFITVQSTPTFNRYANVMTASDATKLNGIIPRYNTPTLFYDHRFGTGSYYGPQQYSIFDTASYETDDVVQIESISGSVATISKRYGKHGDVQQDLGLLDYQTYVQTYGDTQPNYFPGQKRVVLVDSQHMDYQVGETLIISGGAYNIIEATTYLSQSHYIDFTNPATSWTDYIDLDVYMYSGSGYNMAATTNVANDWNKLYRKYTLLTTASRSGTSSLHMSSASLSNPASPNGYEFQAYLPIKRTYFKNGEIEITGSIIRDFTRTGSTDVANLFGIFAGGTVYARSSHVGNIWLDPTINVTYDSAPGFLVNNTDIYSRNRVNSNTLTAGAARYPLIMSQSISVSSQDGDLVIPTFTGSNQTVSLKLEVNQGIQRHYVQNVLIDEFLNPAQQRGTVSVALQKYASLLSIKIKNRYQLLVLDTTASMSYGDRIKQGGLLDTQVAGKTCKFIANEIEDPMGFQNLNWDYFYKKGQTNLNPYAHNLIYNVSGALNTAVQGFIQQAGPKALDIQTNGVGYAQWTAYGKSGADFFITYDLGTNVNFDSVGIGHTGTSIEAAVNNIISGSRIDVADNPDNWTTVWAKQHDLRRSTGGNAIRFYTFPSGSVNKRFIRVYSDGGTANADSNRHGFFGVYSFATASYGVYGASNTTNQIKLRSAKNFAVGDTIMFWNRDVTGTRCDNFQAGNIVLPILYDTITNIHNNAVTDADVVGGKTTYYTITAISGNIITLDRPPAYDHLFVGTIVMKCNRGKLNFVGRDRNRIQTYFLSKYGTFSITHVNMYNATSANGGGVGITRASSGNTATIRCELEDSFIYSPRRNYNSVNGDILRIRNTIGKFNNPPGRVENDVSQTAVSFNMFCLEGLTAWYYPVTKFNKTVFNHLVCMNHNINSTIYDSSIATHGFNSMYDSSFRGGRIYVKNNMFHTNWNDPRMFTAQQNASLSSQISKQLVWGENYFMGNIISGYPGSQFIMNDIFQKCKLIDYRNYCSNVPSENRKGHPNFVNNNIPYIYDQYSYLNNKFNGTIENIRIRFDRDKCLRMQGRFNASLYIFDENTYYSVWSDIPNLNNILDLGNFLLCNFYVKQDAEVRIQLNVSARTTVAKKYAIGTSLNSTTHVATGHEYYGKSFPKILVIDKQTNTVIASKLVSSLQFQDYSINETFNLKQGDYAISFELGYDDNTFSTGLTSTHIFDYTQPTLDILTADVNNIDIINNNWDNYKLLKNIDNNVVTDIYFKDNIGSETVAQTTSDLSSTTRFNKVKL
jgi:hypothetical protein